MVIIWEDIYPWGKKWWIDDSVASDSTTYSSERVDFLLSQKVGIVSEWGVNEIVVKNADWTFTNSWLTIWDLSLATHWHAADEINLDRTNFGGTLSAIWITSLQELADYIDDNVWFGEDWDDGDDWVDGRWISSFTRTSWDGSQGSTDEYTITYTDLTTDTFQVYNATDWDDGKEIVTFLRTSWDGSPWTTDEYTITYNDSSSDTFQVYNWLDGAGSLQWVSVSWWFLTIDNTDPANPIIWSGTLTWSAITWKPTEFNPASHTHTESEITDLDKYSQSEVDSLVNARVLISDIRDLLNSTENDKPLSANQGKILNDKITTLEALFASDETTLDTLQEVVDFIQANRTDLDNLSISAIAWLQSALDWKVSTSWDETISGQKTFTWTLNTNWIFVWNTFNWFADVWDGTMAFLNFWAQKFRLWANGLYMQVAQDNAANAVVRKDYVDEKQIDNGTSLPTASTYTNRKFFRTDEDTLYFSNGTNWIALN